MNQLPNRYGKAKIHKALVMISKDPFLTVRWSKDKVVEYEHDRNENIYVVSSKETTFSMNQELFEEYFKIISVN